MAKRFNPAPGWPKPPAGWSPSATWKPDPAWPTPPSGWQFWVEEDKPGRRGIWPARHWLATAAIAFFVGAFLAGAGNSPAAPPLAGMPASTVTVTAPPLPASTVTATELGPTTTIEVTTTATARVTVTTKATVRQTSKASAPKTDPRFGTCREANAHGYGPYRRGVDPEYYWYLDRDRDGWVCER